MSDIIAIDITLSPSLGAVDVLISGPFGPEGPQGPPGPPGPPGPTGPSPVTINVKDSPFNAKGDGITDDTSAIQAAITAAAAINAICYVPEGVFICTRVDLAAGIRGFIGAGRYATILRRPANDSVMGRYMMVAQNITQVEIASFTLDGNKANETNASVGLFCYLGTSLRIHDIAVISHLAAGPGYGWGVYLNSCSDIVVSDCEVKNCDAAIMGSVKGSDILVADCIVKNNVTGVSFGVQSAATNDFTGINITGNVVTDNSWVGIGISQILPVWDITPTQHSSIVGNTVFNNGSYGIVVQTGFTTVSGNVVSQNGALADGTGGILANASHCVIVGNTLTKNIGFGIDAGAADHCVIRDNEITGTTGASGLNLGASYNCTVSGNAFINNTGPAGEQSELSTSMYDYGGGGAIPQVGGSNILCDNTFVMGPTGFRWGIMVGDSPIGLVIRNNTFIGGDEYHLIHLLARNVILSGNKWLSAPNGTVITAAAIVVFPTYTDTIILTGAATTITQFISWSVNQTGTGAITGVDIANHGAGYTSAPTLTISGDGTGATANATLDNQGHVGAVAMTNYGGNYTTATVAASGGGGTGFVAVPVVGNFSQNGRVITVINKSGNTQTIANNANIRLSAGANLLLPDGGTLTLRSDGTVFYQVVSGGPFLSLSGGTVTGPVAMAALQIGDASGPTWTTGSAAPSSTQPVGSLYSRVSTWAAGATFYVSKGGGAWTAVASV